MTLYLPLKHTFSSLSEVFPHDHIQKGIQRAVAVTHVCGELVAYVQTVNPHATTHNPKVIQRVQKDKNMIREPAQNKDGQNHEDQKRRPLLAPERRTPPDPRVLQHTDDVITAERHQRHRNEKTHQDHRHVVAESPGAVRIIDETSFSIELWEELHRAEQQSRETQEEGSHPNHQTRQLGSADGTEPGHGHGPGQHQVTVQTHQTEEHDAAVVIHGDDNAHQTAHW